MLRVFLCVSSCIVAWASSAQMGRVRFIAQDKEYVSTVHTFPICEESCHEHSYRSLTEVCEREEFSVWRTTEENCGNISLNVSISSWHLSAFTFFQNIRTLPFDTKLLVAFDIVGPVTAIGNWWRVMVRSSRSHILRSHEVIQVAGRVVDQWNGKYSVYIQLPTPGVYDIDILLEYVACSGYPDSFRSIKSQILYHGNYTQAKLEWKATSTATAPLSSQAVDVMRYLADTGYYQGETWHPSDLTYACISQPKLPLHIDTMSFYGDSTMSQLYRCVVREGRFCDTPLCVTKQEKMLNECAAAANTVSAKQRYNIPVKLQINNSLLMENVGLHLVLEPWLTQISRLNKTAHHIVNSTRLRNVAGGTGDIYFIWRDTWSVHEYCFIPNPYWAEQIEHSSDAPWFDDKAYERHLKRLRDPSVHVQRSLALDKIVRQTKKAYWLPAQWLSKAWFKRKGEYDMRHHESVVLIALWKEMLRLLDV